MGISLKLELQRVKQQGGSKCFASVGWSPSIFQISLINHEVHEACNVNVH